MVPTYPSQSEERTEEMAAGLASGEDGRVNQVEEGRKLFAHLLWSAAMVVAEGVERVSSFESGDGEGDVDVWGVRGERVLELGAG